MFTENANRIFNRAIDDYHRFDDVDHPVENPFDEGSLDHLLYMKNWVDTVQWHLEDIIRDPQIDPVEALAIKRRIDKSNQVRTDMVEYIDSYLLDKYKAVVPQSDARLNTETPAWAIDRLSILALKIYHMRQETQRSDVDEAHRDACRKKLSQCDGRVRQGASGGGDGPHFASGLRGVDGFAGHAPRLARGHARGFGVGATHPGLGFLGYGCSAEHAVQADMACRPCSVFGNRPCRYGDFRCIASVAPERIVDEVARLLGR